MSTADSTLTMVSFATPEEVDLGLQLPVKFNLQSLFPHDRLLRLHPNWFVSNFQRNGISFTTTIKDYVTEVESTLSGSFSFNKREDELLCITLSGTVDTDIIFSNHNSALKVKVLSAVEEVDPDDPLLLWIRAIREYIRIYLKRTPVTLFFRLVMNRMVLQMNPSQRKICLMLARFTVLEILVIVFIVVGYVIFVL